MPDFEANPVGTMEALRRAREALGKALSYLRASTDPIPVQPAIRISPTRQLLSEADAIEAKDKAIFQARATLDELNKLLGGAAPPMRAPLGFEGCNNVEPE